MTDPSSIEIGIHEDVNASGVLGESEDVATSALIAEAAAAAMEAEIPADVDVTAAALAAQDAVGGHPGNEHPSSDSQGGIASSSAALVAKKNDQRRKRYREKSVEEVVNSVINDSKKSKTIGNVGTNQSHEEALAARRAKDRQRYANMTPEQRQQYNSKRREQYHKQTENSRQKRRERERIRYHSLTSESAKERNARRAKLERERYQKLTPEELEAKNRKRRERAALARQKKEAAKAGGDKDLTDAVEAAVHDAVKAEVDGVDQNDMPIPPNAEEV